MGTYKIEVNGLEFSTQKKAAHYFNVNYATFKTRRERSWTIEEALGLKHRIPPNANFKAIEVLGISFDCVESASKAYGIDCTLCNLMLDAGLSIKEVFGDGTAIPVRVANKSYRSLKKASISLGISYELFISAPPTDLVIQPCMRSKQLSLNSSTKPFLYGRHIYPSVYLMLMSCKGFNEVNSRAFSKNYSEYRNKNSSVNHSLKEICEMGAISKPSLLSEFELFIDSVAEVIDIKTKIFDATKYLEKYLLDFGFCRQLYLKKYGFNLKIDRTNLRLESHLFAQSELDSNVFSETKTKDAALILGIKESCIRKKISRMDNEHSSGVRNTMLIHEALQRD